MEFQYASLPAALPPPAKPVLQQLELQTGVAGESLPAISPVCATLTASPVMNVLPEQRNYHGYRQASASTLYSRYLPAVLLLACAPLQSVCWSLSQRNLAWRGHDGQFFHVECVATPPGSQSEIEPCSQAISPAHTGATARRDPGHVFHAMDYWHRPAWIEARSFLLE